MQPANFYRNRPQTLTGIETDVYIYLNRYLADPHRNRPQTLTGIETGEDYAINRGDIIGTDPKPLQGLKLVWSGLEAARAIIGTDPKPLQGLKPTAIGTTRSRGNIGTDPKPLQGLKQIPCEIGYNNSSTSEPTPNPYRD